MAELKNDSGFKIKEHESARWLSRYEPVSVDGMPADRNVLSLLASVNDV